MGLQPFLEFAQEVRGHLSFSNPMVEGQYQVVDAFGHTGLGEFQEPGAAEQPSIDA